MSTRCQIQWRTIYFVKDKKGKIKQRMYKGQIYRHSDGYPESVIQDLKEFMEWNKGRNADASYALANFIYYMKKQIFEYFWNNPEWKEKGYEHVRDMSEKLGYGVEEPDKIHGDEEYLYRITAISKNDSPWITDQNFEIYIEIADLHDLPYSGRGKLTFNTVNWKWKGTIDELYEKFVKKNQKQELTIA